MKDILENIDRNCAILLTAPPGWGKTYKLLEAVKTTGRKTLFIFPLRALCDEVAMSAMEKRIDVINIRGGKDIELIQKHKFELITATPEVLDPDLFEEVFQDYVVILDEFHLFYYWGETFRERLLELYMHITSYSLPIMFLSATFGGELKEKLTLELGPKYDDIIHIDQGNRKLKNYPSKILYYPKFCQSWLMDDCKYSKQLGTSLVFCQFRRQVSQIAALLRSRGYSVLTCVGGEASQFVTQLHSGGSVDFIVATTVISHGVNLPNINKVYFTYKVENLDFYLQMLGRGGRTGGGFECHILNSEYFSKKKIILGFWHVLLKRFSNQLSSVAYFAYSL